jgi:PAS domain S-box-containing protein
MTKNYTPDNFLSHFGQNFQVFFNNTNDIAIIYTRDNGEILALNPAARSVLNYEEPVHDLHISDIDNAWNPEEFKDQEEHECFATRTCGFNDHAGEFINIKCTVSVIKVGNQSYFLLIGQVVDPKETGNGKATTDSIIKDLKQREATISSIFQAAPIGMGTLVNRKFTHVNDAFCKMTGYSKKEFLGKSSRILYPTTDEYERVGKLLYEDLNAVGTVESSFKLKNGKIIEVLITTSIYQHEDNNDYVVFTVTDTTEFNKTQRELRSSERRMATLLGNLQGTVYRCALKNGTWTMVFLSDSVTSLTGLNKNDLINNQKISYLDVIHPDDRNHVLHAIKDAVDNHKKFTLEYRIIHKNGNIKWVTEQGKAVYDENNHTFLEGYINEVTKRKHAEEKIKSHLGELSFLSQAAALMLSINSFDELSKFISLKLNELVKNSIVIVFAHERDTGLMELKSYAGVNKNINKVVQVLGRNPVGMKFSVPEEGFEILRKRKLIQGPGGIFEISERKIPKHLATAIEQLLQLKEIHIMGILHDDIFLGEVVIMLQKDGVIENVSLLETFINQAAIALLKIRSEESLRNSEERLRLATNAAQQGLWDLDVTTSMIKTNDTYFTMLGYDAGITQLHLDDWIGMLHPEDKDMAKHIFKQYSKGEISEYRLEYRLKTNNQGWAWIISSGEIIKTDSKGKPVRMVGTHTDITSLKHIEQELIEKNQEIERQNEEFLTINEELKESMERVQVINDELQYAKERAEESDKLKSAFLANMSHEIRTPMNGIIGFSNMLINENISDDKRKSFAKIIIESSQQLLTIVNDILDISKIETGQVNVHEQIFNLNDVILDLFSFYKPKATEKGISLLPQKGLNNHESLVKTDKAKLQQILNNLLSNAMKFTHKGHVKFGYTLINDHLEFFVEDSGIGIPANLHDKVFERFRQADETMNRQYGGTGLGLSISKNLIELMGGAIWLESNEGKGTTFVFKIPYTPVNAISNDPENMPRGDEQNNTRTILIAEDEEVNFLFLEEILSDLDIHILHAKNGLDAVDYFKSNPDIDIILMDIKMPVMNGLEATKEIKKIKNNVPVIAQTAYATEADKQIALEIGCDAYLSKPIDVNELKSLIQHYLVQEKS